MNSNGNIQSTQSIQLGEFILEFSLSHDTGGTFQEVSVKVSDLQNGLSESICVLDSDTAEHSFEIYQKPDDTKQLDASDRKLDASGRFKVMTVAGTGSNDDLGIWCEFSSDGHQFSGMIITFSSLIPAPEPINPPVVYTQPQTTQVTEIEYELEENHEEDASQNGSEDAAENSSEDASVAPNISPGKVKKIKRKIKKKHN